MHLVTELIEDSKGAGIGLHETPEAMKQDILEQRESSLEFTQNGDISEETHTNGSDSMQAQSSSDALSEAASKDFKDGPPSEDVTDSNPQLRGPVLPDSDSPVKAALVKTTSQDYIPAPGDSSTLRSTPDAGNLADLGVVKELGIEEGVSNLELANSTKQEHGNEAIQCESAVDLQTAVPSLGHTNTRKPDTEEKQVAGYRSSLNIAPSSRRTMAASFSGTRHVSEKTESSVKTVTSAVRRQVVSSKQSYVSSVTIPEHSNNGNVIVSVTPSVGQLTEQSPFELENHSFRASNESTTLTHHAVRSEVRRTVTQNNGGDAKTDFSASRLEERLASHSSSIDGKQTVTYQINFEGTPGRDRYTVKKSYSSSLQSPPHASGEGGDISPSGSLLEISSNTVIDEEEEYEQEQVDQPNGVNEQGEADKPNGSAKSTRSESPGEPDSDTESFMSAKEDVTSDTDTAAYMTAGGSSTSLYTDAVSVVDSATEEASTPVNSETEVEDEEDEEEEKEGVQGSGTPRAGEEDAAERSRSGTLKGLREQTTILGSGVTSDGDLGYRGDTEEDLASSEDLRTAGM